MISSIPNPLMVLLQWQYVDPAPPSTFGYWPLPFEAGLGLVFYCGALFWIVAGLSGVFIKADCEGWLCFVPLVNIFVLGQIAGWDGWKLAGLFFPGVNGFFWVLLMVDLAHVFGRGTGFALGLVVMPMVFLPILGLDRSEYLGPRTIYVAS